MGKNNITIPVSAVIIANNNQQDILPTINSLDIFSEIVILFSNKSDTTAEIIFNNINPDIVKNIRFEYQDWQGFGKQKQTVVALAKNDWIFSIDSDEILTEQAQSALAAIDFSAISKNVYKFRRINYFMNKPLYFGEGGSDYLIRLFNRQSANFSDAPVHEKIIYPPEFNVVLISGNINHFSAPSTSDYINKQNRYGEIAANTTRAHNTPLIIAILKLFFTPIVRFIKFYILRQGYKDGWAGFIHILIGCYASMIKYKKIIANKFI